MEKRDFSNSVESTTSIVNPLYNLNSFSFNNEYDIILFCHLRWEFVFQRPQHIITRLAGKYRILIIEEPVPFRDEEENTFIKKKILPNIHVWQPCVKSIGDIPALLKQQLSSINFPIAWFYSAAFIPILEVFKFDTIIYDCMDELSLFKGANKEIIEQEKKLLQKADIVFTGGKSLYESKNVHNSNTYCFRSSVDEEHFYRATKITKYPEDVAITKSPRVGYYGVIDERIDLQLLDETASKMPDISFIMIGPVVKINPSDLPIRDNIHFLGQKAYNLLPPYLASFDIAMMPFALNESTRYISPTKTLEYMAAEKPIISTKVADVVADYSHCIRFIENADDFCNAIKEIFNDEADLKAHYKDILINTSWETTVDGMINIIKQNIEK